jgi:predicted dehydrogenase
VSAFPKALPVSRVPDPMAAPPVRWGVIGTGGIAQTFIDALHRHTRQEVVAVGSRTSERAAAFARSNGIDHSHGSYEALVSDPGIEAVYVASPHSEHRAHALLAISAGRHVLVEKSFTRNAFEAREVVAAARTKGVAAMEAMWTRFLTQTDVIRQLIADGVFGEIRTVIADHGQYFTFDPAHRLFAPALAGGALLDLGIYPVSFAHFVVGAPEHLQAVGELTETGVDAQVSAVLRTGPAHAVVNTTLAARTPTTASISGDGALLQLSGPFYAPASFTLEDVTGTHHLERPTDAIAGHLGLCHEAAHFAGLIADGATESPLLPLDETLAIMTTLDSIRDQIGMRLPGE